MNKAIKMDTGRRRSEQPFCPRRSLFTRGESETHSGSPVCAPAFRSFLDGLAELIAEAIMEENAKGMPVDSENAPDSIQGFAEDPPC